MVRAGAWLRQVLARSKEPVQESYVVTLVNCFVTKGYLLSVGV